MQEELKKCPFCGGEAVYSNYVDEDTEEHTVFCTNNLCEVSLLAFTHHTKEDAIKTWNTRHTEALTQPKPDDVEKALAFLGRLSDNENWSSGYPCPPAICDDDTVVKGCFTASIRKDAKKHASTIKAALSRREVDVAELQKEIMPSVLRTPWVCLLRCLIPGRWLCWE